MVITNAKTITIYILDIFHLIKGKSHFLHYVSALIFFATATASFVDVFCENFGKLVQAGTKQVVNTKVSVTKCVNSTSLFWVVCVWG